MTIICPKCSYSRKPTDSNPEWQCPNCGIAYAKFTERNRPEAKGESSQKDGSASDCLPTPKPQGALKIYLGSGVALAVLISSLVLFSGRESESAPSKKDAASTEIAKSVTKQAVTGHNTSEIIKIGGVQLNDMQASIKITQECKRINGGMDDCRHVKTADGGIRMRYSNYDYAGIKAEAFFGFSEAGGIDYVQVNLPWDRELINLSNALAAKYGKTDAMLNDGYIDPIISSLERVPGNLWGWRDSMGNELQFMIPKDPVAYLNDKKSRGIHELALSYLASLLTPRIYIHSAEMVLRVGGRITDPKTGDSEKIREKRKEMKDKI